jgi:hypothetical protein
MKRVTAALLLTALLTPATAQEKKESLTVVVRRMLAQGDSYRVLEFIQSLGEPEKVAGLYGALAHHYARNENDLALSARMAQAGIRFALTEAQRIAKSNPEGATSLRAQAKTIAYNLAANTWPGWGEEGVEPTPEQMAIGWDAAKLNLRLAVALKKGPEKEAHAYWIIGAHEMAAGEYEAAAESFHVAAAKGREAGIPSSELMAQGYRAVARILAEDTPERRAELEAAKAALKKRADEGDEDAGFYLPQLDTALRIFLERREG